MVFPLVCSVLSVPKKRLCAESSSGKFPSSSLPCSPWLFRPLVRHGHLFSWFCTLCQSGLLYDSWNTLHRWRASLNSLLLVIIASLTSGWVPGRSVRGCITFNELVLYFTETINLRWRYRGVHGPKLCLGSFFSACYVSCFLEREVVALRDTFLTYIFVVCAKYESVSHYFALHLVRVPAVFDQKSCPCNKGVQWSAILLGITNIVFRR